MPLAYDVNILRSIAFKMLHVPKKISLINSYFKKAKIKTKANKQKLKTPKGPTCLYFHFGCSHIIFIVNRQRLRELKRVM